MIKITKGDSPTILTEKGLELTNNLKLAFENGVRKFEFDSALLFKKEIITSKIAKGKETIKRTAIDQEPFEEDRRTYYQAIDSLISCLKLFKEN